MTYDYVIVGAGIAGCSVAYFLHEKEPTKKILILDRHSDIAHGASGAAGAFLSPLLGKPNKLKNLVFLIIFIFCLPLIPVNLKGDSLPRMNGLNMGNQLIKGSKR